jgi:RNA polymerase sigma-70 factor (ECF subfamily)
VERSSEPDDVTLIHRVLSGDEAAFRKIVERYGDRVLRFCRARLGSEEEAADAAQDVFLRVFRSLRSFRLGESFPSWLFAIAANRVRSRGARRGTERAKAERAAIEAASAAAPDPVSEVERSLEAEELRLRVAELPEDLRRVVELYYFAELPVADCARALGLGEEAVKSRLFRARKRLRIAMEQEQRGLSSEGIL